MSLDELLETYRRYYRQVQGQRAHLARGPQGDECDEPNWQEYMEDELNDIELCLEDIAYELHTSHDIDDAHEAAFGF